MVAVVLGLLVGLGAAVLGSRLLDGDDDTAADSDPTAESRRTIDDDDVVDAPDDLLDPDRPVPAGADATSAEEALTGFLDAEVAGDFEASYGYLSAADRQRFGSPAGWVASHADVVPPVLGYELGSVSEEEGATAIATSMRLRPGLDQVVGLTPAEALVTWTLAQEPDGAWGVSLDASTTEPVYASEDGAVPAARRWVDARQACQEPSNERAGLVGAVALADALCDAGGELATGPAEPLAEADGATIATAFGEEAAAAARLVRVTGAVELGVVLAPVGAEWLVIGVVP